MAYPTNTILLGDALAVLSGLPDASVQMACTSPPYYGLRSYLPEGHDEKHLELGNEPTPQEYITRLVEIFREVRRVLRPDGTAWIVIDDSRAGSCKGSGGRDHGKLGPHAHDFLPVPLNRPPMGLKHKDLMMIPARLAIALCDDGWYLRSDVIWHKPNAMPESMLDRPTDDYEHVFLLAKSERYFYDAFAIREEGKEWTGQAGTFARSNGKATHLSIPGQSQVSHREGREDRVPPGRNKRAVWSINTVPSHEEHYACVDEETECLTTEGWKHYDELKPGMMAAQFNLNTHHATWAPLEDIAMYKVTEQSMTSVKSRNVELLLTPNHRTIVAQRHPKTRKWLPSLHVIRADELKTYHALPVSAEWDYQGKTPISADWAELLGWYIAEGCETIHSWTVEIYQSKSANPQKVERIRWLLNTVGADYTEATASRIWRGRPSVSVAFQIRGFAATYLRQLCPGKTFPPDILCWSDALLARLLDGLIDGDGHRRSDDGRSSFIQRSKEAVDIVQAIGVRLGYSTMVTYRSLGTYVVYFTKKRLISFRGTGGAGAKITSKPYTGIVWCPKLPDGTWIARRSGRTFITGNTFPPKLAETCILAGSRPGDVVLDPFMGAGTTALVAIRHHRNWLGIELDPKAIKIASRRIATVQTTLWEEGAD